jgi:hypothetical protein
MAKASVQHTKRCLAFTVPGRRGRRPCICARKERKRIQLLEQELRRPEAEAETSLVCMRRGIRGEPCSKCHGWGRFYYPNTGIWRSKPGMIVGHGFTWGVCDACWGSGDEARPGVDLRGLEEKKLCTVCGKEKVLVCQVRLK